MGLVGHILPHILVGRAPYSRNNRAAAAVPEATPRADGDTTATATDDSDKRPRGGEHKRRSGGERGWAEENA